MSRVYIGSISPDVREEQLKSAFSIFGPIKSVNFLWDTATGVSLHTTKFLFDMRVQPGLQRRKEFAFVEYDVPEAALLAKENMDGRTLSGRCLKVGLATWTCS